MFHGTYKMITPYIRKKTQLEWDDKLFCRQLHHQAVTEFSRDIFGEAQKKDGILLSSCTLW